jgi:uncharacterized protein
LPSHDIPLLAIGSKQVFGASPVASFERYILCLARFFFDGKRMTEFTPISSLAGGILIGLSAVLLMAFHGRIAGISGITAHLFPPYDEDKLWGRAAFLCGLVLAPILFGLVTGQKPDVTLDAGLPLSLIGGALVGFGAVLGSGCTSGHGICGLSRLSKRSFSAVGIFMAAAMFATFVLRHGGL